MTSEFFKGVNAAEANEFFREKSSTESISDIVQAMSVLNRDVSRERQRINDAKKTIRKIKKRKESLRDDLLRKLMSLGKTEFFTINYKKLRQYYGD